jgi:hypothetical protein
VCVLVVVVVVVEAVMVVMEVCVCVCVCVCWCAFWGRVGNGRCTHTRARVHTRTNDNNAPPSICATAWWTVPRGMYNTSPTSSVTSMIGLPIASCCLCVFCACNVPQVSRRPRPVVCVCMCVCVFPNHDISNTIT